MEIRLSTGKRIETKDGESIYETLRRNGIYLVSACGGKGTCGKCKVRLIEGEVEVISYGKLDEKERSQGLVLACQSIPKGDLFIDIPSTSRLTFGDKIAISRSEDLFEKFKSFNIRISPLVERTSVKLARATLKDNTSDLERLKNYLKDKGITIYYQIEFVSKLANSVRKENWHFDLCYEKTGKRALFIESLHKENSRYGLAVDIGTTTVVVYLVNLNDGRVLDIGLTYNSQIRYGDDVIARILYAKESGGLEELRQTVVMDINILIMSFIERHNLTRDDIESVVITGNTTMIHLFWGINPEYIRKEPYIPTVQTFPVWSSRDAGLKNNDKAPVYTVSCVAGYMGADIVAGVLAAGMYKKEEISLFLDIGTNGEIVIGNNDWLMSASCSAGPCFEGSVIKHGMMATEGAIESVKIDSHTFSPEIRVIGNASQTGICGSGMIDAVSEMFLKGIISKKGTFVKDIPSDRIREGEDGMEYLLSGNGTKDIVLTEVDIENIIRAKAAIYGGVSFLIKEIGLTFDVIKKVYIAGGFGNYLNTDKAIILGMLPDMPKDKFVFLGNTSIAGAYLCLLSEELRRESEHIASKMTYMELSASAGFMDEYMSAMFLPHTDISRFPTVKKLIHDTSRSDSQRRPASGSRMHDTR